MINFSKIRDLLFSTNKLTHIERIVLDSVAEQMPDELRKIMVSQISAIETKIEKIGRIYKGMEVNFYFKDKDSIPAFETSERTLKMATASLVDPTTGHQTVARISLMDGILFCINFTSPPGDLDVEHVRIHTRIFINRK